MHGSDHLRRRGSDLHLEKNTSINSEHVLVDELPNYTQASSLSFMWNDIEGVSFTRTISSCYSEIVHWRRNLFKIPSGKAGIAFVRELARLFRSYGEVSAMEGVALKAAMVIPSLLLQKPFSKSKVKDHANYLTRRLEQWLKGDVEAVMAESRSIQHQLTRTRNYTPQTDSQLARSFEKLMFEGKGKAALRLITQNSNSGALRLNSEIKDALVNKHPPRQPAVPSAILTTNNSTPDLHPVVFDVIDGNLICESALKSDGAAGPSSLDAAAWRRLCCSFKSASADLCDALALVARQISSSLVDPVALQPFTAYRLIALDKYPGIRPIGIGVVIRRIISKAIISITKNDIQAVAG